MKIGKGMAGAAAAALLIAASAAPAEARHRDRNPDRVTAGDVIAGVAILGGLVALAAASADADNPYSGPYGAERRAVDRCVGEAEAGMARPTRVLEVSDVVRDGRFYHVTGTLETRGPHWQPGDTGDLAGFSCTVRGHKVHAFTRSDGIHW